MIEPDMSLNPNSPPPLRVAVVGAGPAGAACAAALHAAGIAVTVLEKSRGVGGRMATRRTRYTDAQGQEHTVHFDHGAQHIKARDPRFQRRMQALVAAGAAVPWPLKLRGAASPAVDNGAAASGLRYLPVPGMPALCQHLLQGITVRLQTTVTALVPQPGGGYTLRIAEAASDATPDPQDRFDHVLLAMPPAQAAALLAPHHAGWSQALARRVMNPCWTLMAVTDAPCTEAIDWDAFAPTAGPLAWVSRNDRRPGRVTPAGTLSWVAQASAAWTLQHLEDEADSVAEALQAALFEQLGLAGAAAPAVHHRAVHRWRFSLAEPAASTAGESTWWDASLGLGVCGDSLAAPDADGIEGAWLQGDALAQAVLASTGRPHAHA